MEKNEIVGEHTPGPWIADEPDPRDSVRNILGAAFGHGLDACVPVVCMHLHPNREMRQEQEANALLIACAPEMKAACLEAAGYLLRKESRTAEEDSLMQSLMRATQPYTGRRRAESRWAHQP